MLPKPKYSYTPEEYLHFERHAEDKSEYIDGDIFAMVGASKEHNLITLNIAASFHSQLRKRSCYVFQNDMRVKVNKAGLYTYPDVVVVCGQTKFEDEQLDTLLNPTLIVEVLSKSTEHFDCGEKFMRYQMLDSLKDYLLVAQNKFYIERYSKDDNGQWIFSAVDKPNDVIELQSIGCQLALEDTYEKIVFTNHKNKKEDMQINT